MSATAAATCPAWCTTDHSTVALEDGVYHVGPTKAFGTGDYELKARLELIEGMTDGSDGFAIYIEQPPATDSLRPAAARELAAQLVDWADLFRVAAMSAGLWDDLVDAELAVVKAFGVGVYRTASLDGKNPRWCPELSALAIGTDLTPEEAEEIACEVLGLLACAGAGPA